MPVLPGTLQVRVESVWSGVSPALHENPYDPGSGHVTVESGAHELELHENEEERQQ